MTDLEYLELALESARQAAQRGEVPVGAVVVSSEGQVLSSAHNLRESDQNPVAHAEVLALQAASTQLKSWRLLDCTVYVTLEPCVMCLGALSQARVKRVVFGAIDPKGGALSLGYRVHEDAKLNHRFSADFIPHSECSAILSRFFAQKRR